MRLTLRTLLAYLDDVLAPAEATRLGERIQESEFAGDLVHRIRDCMRRDNLGAPRLEGRGGGFGANTVAEYLDNTLSTELVVDFEKSCLESPPHLAETGCCHQILALVLGEPALVDPDARRRIYQLLGDHDAAMRENHGGKVSGENDGSYAVKPEPLNPGEKPLPASVPKRPEIPDYLKEESRGLPGWWKIAAAAMVAVLLVCVIAMAIGPIWQGGDGGKTVVDGGPDDGKTKDTKVDPLDKSESKTKGKSGDKVVENPPKEVPLPQDRPELLPSPYVTPPKVELPAASDRVATLQSVKTVLIRFNPDTGHWTRVPPLGAISAGESLISLPACRNILHLLGGFSLHMGSETRLELSRPDAKGSPPGIHLHYGRLVLTTVGDPKSPLRFQAGNRQANITFADAGVRLAVEVRFERPPGANPETVPSRTVVDLIAMGNGSVIWAEPGAAPLTVDAPGRHTLGLAEDQRQPDGVPSWVVSGLVNDPLTKTEQLGLDELERELRGETAKKLDESLLEWEIVARRWEVRAMAYRWLINIGKFDTSIAVLRKSSNRENHIWTKVIKAFRTTIARDPKIAAQLHNAFKQARGEEAASLYRMLWDYSDTQLADGGEAARLVGYLEHEDLDYRVLSSWCLSDITGKGYNVFYHPNAPMELRESHVRVWKKRLERGQIKRKQTPAGRGS